MYQAMTSLGFAADSRYRGPIRLEGDPKGASVIILGAGLAGMTAALELRQVGYKVEVLEYNGLNERLERNAKPAAVIEDGMVVVRDPPRPRIEIEAVVEPAALRGAAELGIRIAAADRPVSTSGATPVAGWRRRSR